MKRSFDGGNYGSKRGYNSGRNHLRERDVSSVSVRNLPGNLNTGINVYKKVLETVNTDHGSNGQSNWFADIEYYKNLKKISYSGEKSAIGNVNKYINEISVLYDKYNRESNKELSMKLNELSKRYIDTYPNLDEMYFSITNLSSVPVPTIDNDIKREFDFEVKKIKNSHFPIIYCPPKSTSFDYISRSLRLINEKSTILFSIDIEAYEFDSNIITEIGITIYDPRENYQQPTIFPIFKNYHIIIEESLFLKNKKYVCDFKDCYLHGESFVLKLTEAKKFIQNLVDFYLIDDVDDETKNWNKSIVGHNVKGDLHWLKSIGIRLPDLDFQLTNESTSIIKVLDTQVFYQHNFYDKYSSLGKILKLFNISHSFLHNAGNDSYYTLKALIYMNDINFRKNQQLDNIELVQNKIIKLMERDKTEKRIIPMSYNVLIKEIADEKKSNNNQHPHKRRNDKKLIHQTEFNGIVWFNNAIDAFKYSIGSE